ncbi:MAG TPA: hypothetical protein VNO54_22280 [Streptosporangiaceae bacterium]|nr:hypothetical protein [Streptosporangiaceae bacterium]
MTRIYVATGVRETDEGCPGGRPRAVSTVIAGMRTVRNVERNVAVGDGRGLSAGQQAIVAKHRWERNFYES